MARCVPPPGRSKLCPKSEIFLKSAGAARVGGVGSRCTARARPRLVVAPAGLNGRGVGSVARTGNVTDGREHSVGGGVRPWLSAAMLAGFLVVAAVQLALVVVPVLLLLAVVPGAVALRLGLPLVLATVGVTAYATWRALRTRRAEPAGVPVTRG